jgi:thiamine pyrophosphate-dependent acetolactate synthase large subunit-like protein
MITRGAATGILVSKLTNEVVVTNLGQATQELQQVGDRPLNCYTFGSMGQCSSVALGIALARPGVKVICLDGDGSLLMNLGVLCTVANNAPPNLAIVIWDNGVHMTTGGQPTATSFRSSLAGIARGAGVDAEHVIEPSNEEELEHAFDRVLHEDGPFVVPVKTEKGLAPGRLDRDVIGYKLRFMKALAELKT